MLSTQLEIARPETAAATMNALVYHGPGKPSWEKHAKPKVQTPQDAIIRITTSTICGTDLHILKGDLPTVKPGRILGHEVDLSPKLRQTVKSQTSVNGELTHGIVST